jgi:hypothetical protein
MSDLSLFTGQLDLANQIYLGRGHQNDRGEKPAEPMTLVPKVEQIAKPDHEDDGIQRGVVGYLSLL